MRDTYKMDSESTVSTPGPTPSQKRALTSPYDPNDSKKNRLPIEAEASSPGADMSSTTPTSITLDSSSVRNVAAALKDMLKEELDEMVTKKTDTLARTIIEGVAAGLQTEINCLKSENEKLKSQNVELLERVEKLEYDADASEQYSRRNSLRINGIPETKDGVTTDLDKYIMDICETARADITIADIDRIHRVGKPPATDSSKPRSVIVKFATYRARRKVHILRRDILRQEGIFVNEDLTRARSSLFYEARQLCNGKYRKLNGAWTSDGVILVKDRQDKVHRIPSLLDLKKLAYMA